MRIVIPIGKRRYEIAAEDSRNWVLHRIETRKVVHPRTKQASRREVDDVMGYFSGPAPAIRKLVDLEAADSALVGSLEMAVREFEAIRGSVLTAVQQALSSVESKKGAA